MRTVAIQGNSTRVIEISPTKLKAVVANPVKSAEIVNLVYVKDGAEGITRTRRGKSFTYHYRGKKITDKKIIERIRKLVLPPAWKKVWICANENGHLQATGYDALNRKQYKYHALWNSLRNQTKYSRLQDFGKTVPLIRKQLNAHLALPGLPQEKVLAAVVSLMELTSIRVGNNYYEKLYGSFGLTTLKDQHVKIRGAGMQFAFKGKKGVMHSISLRNKRLAAVVKKCRDIPGKELFQYKDETGVYRTVDSGMVNNYIKTICGQDFTAKDFRTWSGSVNALAAFMELGPSKTVTGRRKNVVTALDMVSQQLGNTRTVCKKYYVHPTVITLYENEKLDTYLKTREIKVGKNYKGLTGEEKLLMKILEKNM
ncbi:MAG TPA: hypothetical protein VK177_18325 [Flavobacteriales bacterium]|nr:hypothetical protein [Flavobacteriales bacterium]